MFAAASPAAFPLSKIHVPMQKQVYSDVILPSVDVAASEMSGCCLRYIFLDEDD